MNSETMHQEINQDLQEAQKLFNGGQLEDAESICLKYIHNETSKLPFLILLAIIKAKSELPYEGIELLNEAISSNQKFALAYFNRGIMLVSVNRTDEAEEDFRKATEINPYLPGPRVSLGVLLFEKNQRKEAEFLYRQELEFVPNSGNAYFNLGSLLLNSDRIEEAIDTLRNALKFPQNTNLESTEVCLGIALRLNGEHEEAYGILNKYPDSPAASIARLMCLLEMGQYDDFFSDVDERKDDYSKDIRISSISALAAQELGRDDPHPYCPNPMERIKVIDNLGLSDLDECRVLINDLINDLNRMEKHWEPSYRAVVKGYQTAGNAFNSSTFTMHRLSELLNEQIALYREELSDLQNGMILNWPQNWNFWGWFVSMPEGGYEDIHIHPHGWLSGVIYLRIPETVSEQDGSIEFTLDGPFYPKLSKKPLSKIHIPAEGQLVLFPSSLGHRTLPFKSETDRISFAFDVRPD